MGRWFRDHPRLLEWAYRNAQRILHLAHPLIRHLGYQRSARFFQIPEDFTKRILFDCRVCGQCILHSTGMTCPMTCPKNIRNGPCGGVRINGHCEVIPEMRCVWVEAYERSKNMRYHGHEMSDLQPPVNRQLEGTSAWINMLSGLDKKAPVEWNKNT